MPIAIDGGGDAYYFDAASIALHEFARAFVDPTPKSEGPAAGNDVLPIVLPTTQNLQAPFAPKSSQSWLTITGVSGGAVNFSFTANNTSSNRTANIALLGQTIPVTQIALPTPPTLLGATLLAGGVVQIGFTNSNPSASFTVLSSTDLTLPVINWTVLGVASNIGPGLLQFTDPQAGNVQCFYALRFP